MALLLGALGLEVTLAVPAHGHPLLEYGSHIKSYLKFDVYGTVSMRSSGCKPQCAKHVRNGSVRNIRRNFGHLTIPTGL